MAEALSAWGIWYTRGRVIEENKAENLCDLVFAGVLSPKARTIQAACAPHRPALRVPPGAEGSAWPRPGTPRALPRPSWPRPRPRPAPPSSVPQLQAGRAPARFSNRKRHLNGEVEAVRGSASVGCAGPAEEPAPCLFRPGATQIRRSLRAPAAGVSSSRRTRPAPPPAASSSPRRQAGAFRAPWPREQRVSVTSDTSCPPVSDSLVSPFLLFFLPPFVLSLAHIC